LKELKITLNIKKAIKNQSKFYSKILILKYRSNFLLQAIRIISKNVKCEYKGIFSLLPCEMNHITLPPSDFYLSQEYTDSTCCVKFHGSLFNTVELDLWNFGVDHAYGFEKLESVITQHPHELNKRAFLVSGPVMTRAQLSQLKTTEHYDMHLDQIAARIAQVMKKHASR
jgi:hypothetical protein